MGYSSLGATASSVFLVVMIMGGVVVEAGSKISCGKVTLALAPCFEFLSKGGTVPPLNCCNGVKSLYNAANTTFYRRAVCSCLKSITKTAPPTAVQNAKELPGKCGVFIPYQITPAIDCSKVN